ncbi:THO complex subunit 2 isoform X2 [Nymphaea colorata]|uniref:THO complex subunit 2 isoform X2 n=1 Tax=Nymphaea colorata TaxID=210225 RepID=UPI00129EDEC8|nr:THO complex subunit 2 isoform X2 [Nymphaea colorata]
MGMSSLSVECKFVTEDCIREWKVGSNGFRLAGPVPATRFIYELCWAMVRGDLPMQRCKPVLDSVEFLEKTSKEEVGSIFADIVAHMGQDLTMLGEYRVRLVKMAKWLVESATVPLRLFQERCEEEFLWESEMIKIKAQDLKSKEVRVNTRLLYQQTKFNLLREESEGYAKLVTLLSQVDPKACTQNTSNTVISIIKSLIGHFDLDPNRVFDIVLECFELQPDNDIFFHLIPIFPKSHASQILGFKFQYYQRMEVGHNVPHGLYRLTALLVKSNFIDLDSIYAHLLPKDEEAFELYEAFSAKRFEEANKIGKINLAAIGKDLMEDEKQGDVSIDLYSALDMENESVEERSSELVKNQSLGLLNGFLSVDDWYHAKILFDRLAAINPVAHPQICDGLLRTIEKSISSAYDLIRQAHLQSLGQPCAAVTDTKETSTFSMHKNFCLEFPREVFQMLYCVGPYLYRDTLLLQKVCRVLRRYYQSAQELHDISAGGAMEINGGERDPRLQLKEAGLRVEESLGTCLLPSLQLIPANPAVGQEIWELMSLLPYEVRYRLYGEWERDDEKNPMVFAARQTAKLDTRRILKRLAKENLKQLGRMVAKLAHANPMTVLRTIVHQIEAYRDMIAPVVDAFKYLTQLEYDMLEYVVIERLAQGGREKIKDDGLNLSDWLQSLASFWGHLCKKYPSMELRGLFQYLVNQLKKGNGIELILLQELIQQMANVQYTENMTEEQLDAMGGGETLRFQATSFGITRNNKVLTRSTNRLRDALLPKDEPKLAIPLLLLIAQHRSMVVINADAQYIKMLSEQFDRCHGSLLQYVEFLSSAVTPSTAYAQLIPTLDDLVHKYHLDPEVAFLIYRPVMRLFKYWRGSDIFWPCDVIKETISDKDSEVSATSDDMVLDLGSSHKCLTWTDLLNTVRSMLPVKAWNSLSPDLYVTFWGLTLYDLYVPKHRYESEIAKQHASLKALEELADNSSSAITKRKKEKERVQEILDRLTNEYRKHEEHVASVHRRLSHEKDIWLTSCPDTLKINMEFLQRCIFPRCTFSMPDAVYCAFFVRELHSLGTPFFNTVNHIDVLICKTLQPMICCCTEYEAGRLGRFLYETLKMAYYWKSSDIIYERECGNMPGFAVYYRDPNSQRVTYSQFIRVHWKWSGRITRLLIQCLESTEYMEIRNALIILTKISSVFPVTKKSGINLEKRVAKIKGDEREDLKVLATGVAAALAARKTSWVSEEEFGMGFVDLKPAASPAKHLVTNALPAGSTSVLLSSQNETAGARNISSASQAPDISNPSKEQVLLLKPVDGKLERSESVTLAKHDVAQIKTRSNALMGNTSNVDPRVTASSTASQTTAHKASSLLKNSEDIAKGPMLDESTGKVLSKAPVEFESRSQMKRMAQGVTKQAKQDSVKDDTKSGRSASRVATPLSSAGEREPSGFTSEVIQGGAIHASVAAATNGGNIPGTIATKTSTISSRTSSDIHANIPAVIRSTELRNSVGSEVNEADIHDPSRSSTRSSVSPLRYESGSATRNVDKQQRRPTSVEEAERLNKRRKGESEVKDGENLDVRHSDRERSVDQRLADKLHTGDHEKISNDEHNANRAMEKLIDRPKEKVNDRLDRDHRERPDKSRGDSKDRSTERYGREKSVDRIQERGAERSVDRTFDKIKDEHSKDDRNKLRYVETSAEKSHAEDRYHGQSLPPPPPLPPNVVPQSVSISRREEESDRRAGNARYMQRLSPRHEDKERRRSEENLIASLDDAKRRREEDMKERKRDDRDILSVKAEDRERDKGSMMKEDIDAAVASKRRRLKREHLPSEAGGDYLLATAPPLASGMSQSYDSRNDRKGAILQRAPYGLEDQMPRMHTKEAAGKVGRRDNEPTYDRDWEDEKRQRAEPKRRHRK